MFQREPEGRNGGSHKTAIKRKKERKKEEEEEKQRVKEEEKIKLK